MTKTDTENGLLVGLLLLGPMRSHFAILRASHFVEEATGATRVRSELTLCST